MSCSFCGKESKKYVKGLCKGCYMRQWKTGSLEYQRWNQPVKMCSVEGCENEHAAGGFCDKHYRMNKKRGTPVSDFGYGERRAHPLYDVWRDQKRSAQGRVKEWDNFWVFVSECPEKPEGNVFAKRKDDSAPWGPGNFYWYETLGVPASDLAAWRKVYRTKNSVRLKGHDLKKDYGISVERYEEMYRAQNGCCAMCGEWRPLFSTEQGKRDCLVVDHDHDTGAIRGLLCNRCNVRLGQIERIATSVGMTTVDWAKKAAEFLADDSKSK